MNTGVDDKPVAPRTTGQAGARRASPPRSRSRRGRRSSTAARSRSSTRSTPAASAIVTVRWPCPSSTTAGHSCSATAHNLEQLGALARCVRASNGAPGDQARFPVRGCRWCSTCTAASPTARYLIEEVQPCRGNRRGQPDPGHRRARPCRQPVSRTARRSRSRGADQGRAHEPGAADRRGMDETERPSKRSKTRAGYPVGTPYFGEGASFRVLPYRDRAPGGGAPLRAHRRVSSDGRQADPVGARAVPPALSRSSSDEAW